MNDLIAATIFAVLTGASLLLLRLAYFQFRDFWRCFTAPPRRPRSRCPHCGAPIVRDFHEELEYCENFKSCSYAKQLTRL